MEGGTVLDFCRNHQLKILNTYFKKDREKYITYKSGGAETQIDLILTKKVRGVCVTDCKAIPGEACLTQHRLVCAAFQFSESKKKMEGNEEKFIWKLKDRETRDVFEERLKKKIASSGDGEWKNLEEGILSAGGEICGITSAKRGRERETWWWNDVVQQRLKEKKVAYKRWQWTGMEVDRETYKDRK